MRVTNLLSTDNNMKKTSIDSDEETTSLTSNSSASEVQPNPRREERKNRRSKGGKKNNNSTNNRRGKRSSKATSTKPHDAPMQKRDMYFALDCEMVGVGPEGLDSVLARLSIINWDNELVFDTYVKVEKTVTDYRTFVSGIRQEDIESESALTLEEAQYQAFKILKGKILIGHGLENDLKVIGICHPWCDIRDTATYQPYMRQAIVGKGETPMFRPRRLRDLAWETLGKQIQVMGVAHSPIEDAIASMDLYKVVRTHWEVSIMKQVHSCIPVRPVENKTERPPIMSRFRKVAIQPTTPPYNPHTNMQQMKSNLAIQSNRHQQQQHYESYITKPQPVGGAYHQNTTRQPTTAERLALARVAQQQARMKASLTLQYQTMMQNGMDRSVCASN